MTARAAVAVVDLGLGNLGSVLQALMRAGGDPLLSRDPEVLARAPRVVVPGVAAFGLGMERANALGLRGVLDRALGRAAPVLGICLGMQILFEEGEEDGVRPGLGLLPGRVTLLPPGVQAPHIGWQRLVQREQGPSDARSAVGASSPLLARGEAPWAYFAHSYRCDAPGAITAAVAVHEPAQASSLDAAGRPARAVPVAAVVARGTLHGVQFHPEKSAADGQALLARFLGLPEGARA